MQKRESGGRDSVLPLRENGGAGYFGGAGSGTGVRLPEKGRTRDNLVVPERKYSVLYYYGEGLDKDPRTPSVYFISQDDKDEMAKFGEMLDDKDVVVVVREKQMPEIDKTLDFDVILDGRKFSLVKVH